ncbi:nucleosome assembly protein [Cystoisospora suis]|uniref:Nucleosome assembly protein n=1 Tax=Cystoisospora suis TaxID=483139 RepID=A0A2C6KQ70_9APIC|nr:nucleosome assembly protein [Cystoisospora suis]
MDRTHLNSKEGGESGAGGSAGGGADIELISNRLEGVTITDKQGDSLQGVGKTAGGVSPGGIEENEIYASLTKEQKEVVTALQAIQSKHDELERQYDRDLIILKMKYENLYAPLYKERKEILLQKQPSSSSTGAGGGSADTANNTHDASPTNQPAGTPALPSFWLNCMKQNSTLNELIEEHDEKILAYLENISCEYFTVAEQEALEEREAKKEGRTKKDEENNANSSSSSSSSSSSVVVPESFRLVFEFSPNEYFKTPRLVKEYHLTISSSRHGAELTSTKSTEIEWNEGKDVTKKIVTRRQRNKKTKQVRTIQEVVDSESFFNFFTDHEIPSDDKLETMSDKQVGELQMIVEADYDIGVTIRDKIIPQAVEWFLGEADDDDDDQFDEDDDDEFDDDEDDDDEDDMFSSDGEDERPKGGRMAGGPRGKGAKGAKGPTIPSSSITRPGGGEGKAKGGQQDQPPECKQQ